MAVPRVKEIDTSFVEETNELQSVLSQEGSEIEVHEFTGSVARLLMDTRRSKKYEIKDIADKLRISARYLEAIETANKNEMPERVYALGFIKSYARFLNLNEKEILARYKEEILLESPEVNYYKFDQKLPATHPTKKLLWFSIPVALLMGGVLWLFLYPFLYSSTDNASDIAPIPQQLIEDNASEVAHERRGEESKEGFSSGISDGQQPNPEKTNLSSPEGEKLAETPSSREEKKDAGGALIAQAPTTPLQPVPQEPKVPSVAPAATPIVLHFSEQSWIEIRDAQGAIVINRLFNAGDSYELPKGKGLTLTTGNAGGIRVHFPGKTEKVLGKRGGVLKQLSLDEAFFLAYLESH